MRRGVPEQDAVDDGLEDGLLVDGHHVLEVVVVLSGGRGTSRFTLRWWQKAIFSFSVTVWKEAAPCVNYMCLFIIAKDIVGT